MGVCKEAQIVLEKYPQSCEGLFSLIMGIHTKKRRLHQANFLLLHCYENALRSVLAVHIANLHNVSCDDWF